MIHSEKSESVPNGSCGLYFLFCCLFLYVYTNLSLSLYKDCANCYWTLGELYLYCLSVFKIEKSSFHNGKPLCCYVATQTLNFLMASNCFLITALIQTVHYLCCTRSWYNTVSITSMSRVSEVVRFDVLTTKLNRKAMSVVGGGSLSGLVFKRNILSILYLYHTAFSHSTTLLYFLPSSHWIACLSCHVCRHFLILFWLSWILTALNRLTALCHKCVTVLFCSVCSVISKWLLAIFTFPFFSSYV